ncbi:hypothetical protein [Natrinema sp. 1APR25-10V2]|uniref:DUF7344 domain-containing protein n=1 Tax=Natrinema sp. 1APR25-10V2 TaxID=2951081 RepID=UPI0028757BA8|nr:hypothetical protein [Natrinema sp. 1APR25-10V2]MDS0474671.1 hypothetical protein [Natrinema sp. 1APR25-10V2]
MSKRSTEFDTVLELCRHPHRRTVLAVLAQQKRAITIQDITKTIAKHTHEAPLTEASGETLTRIQHSLHHVHLPKIEAAGVIDYDGQRHQIEPTQQLSQLQPFLTAIIKSDPTLDPPVEL